MGDKYPIWNGPEIFDELVETVLKSINEFEVYPQDTARGLYYDIPVVHLHTRSEETKGNDEKIVL